VRDSVSKRLGRESLRPAKIVNAGSIIIRQRGTKWEAGENVGTGRDWTFRAQRTAV